MRQSDAIGKLKGLPKEAMEKLIPVGPHKSPRGFIKRNEIENYLDVEFFNMYRVWKMYFLKLGLPGGLPWDLQPNHIIDIIETFQDEYVNMNPKG